MSKYYMCIFALTFLFSCHQKVENTKLSGAVFGTSYSVIYDSTENYQVQFDSLFNVVNQSLSTYWEDSDISKLNRNESRKVDNHFIEVFEASKELYKVTEGAFDPTIGAVVNAWDFGPGGKIIDLDSLKIHFLMKSVGFDKVLRHENEIIKPDSTFLDFNAIAKGYGVDVIGQYLESRGVKNYLVEIGGEIRVKGINVVKKANWRVGVEAPNFEGEQSILKAIELKNESMATSGTYRKFKVDDQGNKYAHIIDTKTGYPSKTNLLGISVIAKDCMAADALATAFKVMGIAKTKEFLNLNPQYKVFLIFENQKNEFETLSLNGFPE